MSNSCQIPESGDSSWRQNQVYSSGFENRFNQNLQELNLTSSQMHLLVYLDRCESEGKKVNQRMIEKAPASVQSDSNRTIAAAGSKRVRQPQGQRYRRQK